MSIRFQIEAFLGENWRQRLKFGAIFKFVRVQSVNGFDSQEPVVLLRILRRSDLTDDHVSSSQSETADLRLRDINIVRPGQIMLGAQESHSLIHDLEYAATQLEALAFGLRLHEAQDEVLLLEAGCALDLHLFGFCAEIG